MDTESNGGPAFPRTAAPNTYQESHDGMTLRDYFAAKAMQGFLANPQRAKNLEETHVPGEIAILKTAEHAYMVADAMLAERAK